MNRPSWTLFSRIAGAFTHPTTAVFALAALGTIGCIPFGDPEPPGASGKVALAEGVAVEELATLRFRAAPDAPFNPEAPSFPDASGEGSDWLVPVSDLTSISFPFEYIVDGSGPTTPSERWQVFAWLSASPSGETLTEPASGEPYGRATFTLEDCGNFGDYCTAAEGIDITIDQVAP